MPARDVPVMPARDVPVMPARDVPVMPARDVPAPPARRQRRLARGIALAVLVVFALALIGGGGAALARELTRRATKAEQAAAVQAEIASRWQRLPAGKIFPATVSYPTSDVGVTLTAGRVGIAPAASCAAALDPPVASLLRRFGCVTVLRATYTDASGTLAVTSGIAVMTSAAAASRAVGASATVPPSAGVRTFRLTGTVADLFGDAQRRAFSAILGTGPYVFLYAAGYTDGRASGSAVSTPVLTDLGSSMISSMETVLTAHGGACTTKDIRC